MYHQVQHLEQNLLRRHFIRSQDMKEWRPRSQLSVFSSLIFRSFPIMLDLLEHKMKSKMLQNTLLGKRWASKS